MEEKYWELLEECKRAFDKWLDDGQQSSLLAYNRALSTYQDFCMDVLERLIDENADVLKRLKD